MESDDDHPCSCSCLCCSAPSPSWRRSLKRKLEALSIHHADPTDVAFVEIENEVTALREALAGHQLSIHELHVELEEERNSAATAASEAMSMILRLQREKAEAQMDARQFKRFAEEKMSHDQFEITSLEDLLFKRDQAIQSLHCEVQAYRHRLLSLGFAPDFSLSIPSSPVTPEPQFDPFDYPPLRCKIPSTANDKDQPSADVFVETPKDLEQRICQLERMPSSSHEKGVVGYFNSPRRQQHRHLRRGSLDGYSGCRGQEFPVLVDRASDSGGRDDMSDRVYTVDAVHGASEDYVGTPRELENKRLSGGEVEKVEEEEGEIKRLYMRLQALEADRESMRQTIISMGTDKAQLVLLKEIAQQLCKEVAPVPQVQLQPFSPRKIVKKTSFLRTFSIMSAIKWVTSFVFWRKRSSRIKYTFGISSNSAGLLLLLDKSSRMRQRRCLTRAQR